MPEIGKISLFIPVTEPRDIVLINTAELVRVSSVSSTLRKRTGAEMIDYPRVTQTFVNTKGSREAAGRRLGKDVRTIGHWICGDNDPDIKEDVIPMLVDIIEEGTQADAEEARRLLQKILIRDCGGIRKAFLLVDPAFKGGPLLDTPLESAPLMEELPYFKRFALSKEDPAWEVEQRGRPAKNAEKGKKKCADQHTFKGRIKDFIRKKYQLGGKDYCAQAEEIWERERYDLMDAVDVGLLFMSDAKRLLVIPAVDAEWQEVLGSGDKKRIQAFMKARGLK